MNLNELEKYFDALDVAENAIGFRKENCKHLARIEIIKELLLYVVGGIIPCRFNL